MSSCAQDPDSLQLTDTVTSLALSTMGIAPPTGVSVNISTEFVRPGGREGDELFGVGEVTKIGESRSVAFLVSHTQSPLSNLQARLWRTPE